jgi:ParB family chromosome partitioning protein
MGARKKKAQAKSVGLEASEVTSGSPPAAVQTLMKSIEGDDGTVLSAYKEPLGGNWCVLCVLPIEKVEPTPYQRELSKSHSERLSKVIPKVGRYLDPVIAMKHDKGYWTPNGMHRLVAMRLLGAKAITALVVPEPEVAFRILALNTEKAHNLKDKSLEVMRMAKALSADSETAKRPEADWAFEFEEPAYLTIGLCYEEKARFSGGAYLSVLRRCDQFSSGGIKKSMEERADRAKKVLELDELVGKVIEKLKAAGLTSPYLRPFVIARINPLRWIKAAKPGQKAPSADFDATMDKMIAAAKKFDASKIKPSDIAATGGPAPEADE